MCYTQSLKSITMLVVHPDAGTRVSRRAKHHLCRLRGGGRNALGVHTLWLGSVEIQNAEIHDPGVELAYEAQITTVACGEADRVCVARLHCKKSVRSALRRESVEIQSKSSQSEEKATGIHHMDLHVSRSALFVTHCRKNPPRCRSGQP